MPIYHLISPRRLEQNLQSFLPSFQAMRMIIHLGETVPETLDPDGSPTAVYRIGAGTLLLWAAVVFALMLLTFGIGAASGALHDCVSWFVFLTSLPEEACNACKQDICYLLCGLLMGWLRQQRWRSFCPPDSQLEIVPFSAPERRGNVMVTGIFIPSLAIGGAWGRVVGMVVQAALTNAGSSLMVSLPSYAVRIFPIPPFPQPSCLLSDAAQPTVG